MRSATYGRSVTLLTKGQAMPRYDGVELQQWAEKHGHPDDAREVLRWIAEGADSPRQLAAAYLGRERPTLTDESDRG
jgi:hypothetical protein